MYNFFEFLIYTIMAMVFYKNMFSSKIDKNNKKIHFDDIKLNSSTLSMYNDVLKEYHYNKCLYEQICNSNDGHITIKNDDSIYKGESRYGYKHGCGKIIYDENVYEGFWENDIINGFGILYNNNISVSGYKQNNNYHGLVKIDGSKFSNTPIKYVDCIYENGIQKSCFVVDNKQNIKFVIPENIRIII